MAGKAWLSYMLVGTCMVGSSRCPACCSALGSRACDEDALNIDLVECRRHPCARSVNAAQSAATPNSDVFVGARGASSSSTSATYTVPEAERCHWTCTVTKGGRRGFQTLSRPYNQTASTQTFDSFLESARHNTSEAQRLPLCTWRFEAQYSSLTGVVTRPVSSPQSRSPLSPARD